MFGGLDQRYSSSRPFIDLGVLASLLWSRIHPNWAWSSPWRASATPSRYSASGLLLEALLCVVVGFVERLRKDGLTPPPFVVVASDTLKTYPKEDFINDNRLSSASTFPLLRRYH